MKLRETDTLEKVPTPRREPYFKTLWRIFTKEVRLLASGIFAAFSSPVVLIKRIFWPKAVDNAIRKQAQWFEIKPDKPNGIAVLLIHGFAATPETFHQLAPALADFGYHPRAARLSGHGTSPSHLARTSGVDWFATVAWHYQQLAKEYDRIFIVGHSLGGTLGLLLSTIYPIETVVALTTPVKLHISSAKYVRQASILVKYWPRSKEKQKKIEESGLSTYPVSPLYAIAGIFEVGKVLRDRADKLDIPVLYVRAKQDHKSLLDQPEEFRKHFPNTPTTFKDAENSPHSLLIGPDKDEVFMWITDWLEKYRLAN